MRRVLRWVAWILAGLLGLIVVVFIAVFAITEFRLRQTYEVVVKPVVIPTDAASIEYGRHIGTTWGLCTICHGDGLEGELLSEDAFAVFAGPNLTGGEGGVGAIFDDEDWVRAIRHGLKPDGKSALFMLSTYSRFSDEELGAVIAWARSLPPVDNVVPRSRLRLLGRIFLLFEPGFILPASEIDHGAVPIPVPPPGPTAAYGEHIGRTICALCHGDNFAGGEEIEGTDGVMRLSRNLTPAGNLANWTKAEFDAAMRTGVTPAGDVLDPEAMPWDHFTNLTEAELEALWLFLQKLPPAQPDDS